MNPSQMQPPQHPRKRVWQEGNAGPVQGGAYLAPRRVLCVVVVTTSAYLKGEGITLAATRPLMWAMSASR